MYHMYHVSTQLHVPCIRDWSFCDNVMMDNPAGEGGDVGETPVVLYSFPSLKYQKPQFCNL